jgi:hypothetical protein
LKLFSNDHVRASRSARFGIVDRGELQSMKLRKRILATASALTLFAGVGFLASAPAGAVIVPINVANDHVTCQTLSGTVKFTSALKTNGPTTGSQTTKVTAALAGCLDDNNAAVKMFKGAITATLTSNNGHACAGLLGASTDNGSANILWTPATGQAFTPTALVGTAQKPVTNVTFSQVGGGTYSVTGQPAGAWSSVYGEFSIGTLYGTTPLVDTVDFTGGDNGASGWFAGTTQQDIGNILTTCGSTAGLTGISFGIGAVHS